MTALYNCGELSGADGSHIPVPAESRDALQGLQLFLIVDSASSQARERLIDQEASRLYAALLPIAQLRA